jgi:hypothetical protein
VRDKETASSGSGGGPGKSWLKGLENGEKEASSIATLRLLSQTLAIRFEFL